MTQTALTNADIVQKVLAEINLDVSELVKYDKMKRDLAHIDIITGAALMRDFLNAYEIAADLAIKAKYMLEGAVENMKHEEAKAVLERAPKYFEENETLSKSIKDSKSLRETYLQLDEQYRNSKEKVAALKALVRLLDNKVDSYRMAHDDAKKIYSQLAGGPFGKTGYQGMPVESF